MKLCPFQLFYLVSFSNGPLLNCVRLSLGFDFANNSVVFGQQDLALELKDALVLGILGLSHCKDLLRFRHLQVSIQLYKTGVSIPLRFLHGCHSACFRNYRPLRIFQRRERDLGLGVQPRFLFGRLKVDSHFRVLVHLLLSRNDPVRLLALLLQSTGLNFFNPPLVLIRQIDMEKLDRQNVGKIRAKIGLQLLQHRLADVSSSGVQEAHCRVPRRNITKGTPRQQLIHDPIILCGQIK